MRVGRDRVSGACMMRFAPCIVIPIYNHKDAIGATVAHLAVHGLPIFVVDDGSAVAIQQVLASLAHQYAGQLTLLRVTVNGGKSSAVMGGAERAPAPACTPRFLIRARRPEHPALPVPVT